MDQARNFVLSISPEYHVFREEVEGVTLLGYSFPFDITIGEAAFQATVEAFKLYNQLFGPYPHESLSMVQADFLHGMEYDGLYFLSKAFYNTYDGTPATYLVAIAAHETAHQWWFGLVANDQALEPWLDEALCTFAERLYYENLYPESLKWWVDYRVDYYEPQGWVDVSIYDSEGYRSYRDAVYLNGMNFLTELRDLVGADVFMVFLSDYRKRNTKELASAADFFEILREHSDADWNNLKSKYFQNP
jgi:aminopeptidase N